MNKNEIEIKTYSIPSYLACYIAYGDEDNLTDNEIQEYNKFLKRINLLDNGYYKLDFIDIGKELGFCPFNDMNDKGNDCIELIAFYNKV